MIPWHAWWLVWLLAALAQAAAWLWAQRTRNATLVDAVWASGVGGSAVLLAALGPGAAGPRALLAVAGGAWGLRLGVHLWARVREGHEDGRYQALRERWGERPLPWFLFFQFQAALVALFALPFLPVAANPNGRMHVVTVLAIGLWIVAVGGESMADRQLARFRADPSTAGTVCRQGLWRYSRHPNYFFEWLHWFAYPLLAIGAPMAWLAWLGPVLMYVFLRWLSGIPHTEAQALRSRGDAYRDYQRTTPMLIPWFPRRSR